MEDFHLCCAFSHRGRPVADGTVWHADYFGAPLLGDFRADAYHFGRGSGVVRILDFDFSQFNDFRESDVVSVGSDISPTDVTISRVNEADLVLSITGTTDRLTIQSFFQNVVGASVHIQRLFGCSVS